MCRSHAQSMENCNYTFHVTHVYPSNYKRPPPIRTQFHFVIQLTSQSSDRPALDTSQKVQTLARRPVCTVWFYRHQTTHAPSGTTDLRPGLHRLILPPLDHTCTAWFHRRQNTLATPGSTALRPHLHRLVPSPLDHTCTAWFHRRQNTLAPPGSTALRPLL
jgi:hypothetical protein